jgi:hypothetical protein
LKNEQRNLSTSGKRKNDAENNLYPVIFVNVLETYNQKESPYENDFTCVRHVFACCKHIRSKHTCGPRSASPHRARTPCNVSRRKSHARV